MSSIQSKLVFNGNIRTIPTFLKISDREVIKDTAPISISIQANSNTKKFKTVVKKGKVVTLEFQPFSSDLIGAYRYFLYAQLIPQLTNALIRASFRSGLWTQYNPSDRLSSEETLLMNMIGISQFYEIRNIIPNNLTRLCRKFKDFLDLDVLSESFSNEIRAGRLEWNPTFTAIGIPTHTAMQEKNQKRVKIFSEVHDDVRTYYEREGFNEDEVREKLKNCQWDFVKLHENGLLPKECFKRLAISLVRSSDVISVLKQTEGIVRPAQNKLRELLSQRVDFVNQRWNCNLTVDELLEMIAEIDKKITSPK